MSTDAAIEECVETAAESVGSVWPLHSFVTANPLAGFEDRPFHEAVADAEQVLGGRGYPRPEVFRRALDAGQVDRDLLCWALAEYGYEPDPAASLETMAAATEQSADETGADRVDAVLTKWLSAFLDQGQAEWPMPDREEGFYQAFRAVAPHDSDVPDAAADLSADPVDAIRDALDGYPVGEWQGRFEAAFAALPGWTGLVKQRVADETDWQSAYPITLTGYLAVRLALADAFDAHLDPAATEDGDRDLPVPEVWLRAWEATYRSALVDPLTEASVAAESEADDSRPDAQLVFCIDTRSEILRRHVESTGAYETHGYAGFFGVPMRYDGYDTDVTVDACPPILDAEHRVEDRPAGPTEEYDRWHAALSAGKEALESLRSNAATAFSFVESAGPGYGVALAARTLLPERVYDLLDRADERVPTAHDTCEPALDHDPDAETALPAGLTLEERVEYAATAFELMGWEQFARLVVFAGHASHTTNNPYDSSLDCGACAGNPGGPSARVLASICNDDQVRAALADRGIEIPEDTYFVAGEHDTTTDEVTLYADDVPETHQADVDDLRVDLEAARTGAAAERAGDMGAPDAGVRETERRAADWAETRPEWGLAGNASFVIGPRELTEGLDLDGRAFLHSYDPRTDPDGTALAAIVTGPLVVTQWINAQYYFSTVDNAAYGSGSKVTHNPVGNVGVYQGNGGDLMTGLPLQSLMSTDEKPYHQPLRLSAVIHAPVDRVTEVLRDHEDVAGLLDNGWLSLTVVDPEQDHRAFGYEGDCTWTPLDDETRPERVGEPAVADD